MKKPIAAFLSLLSFLSPGFAAMDYEKVKFNTKDSVALIGFYRAPERDLPVVVMLHGLGSAKEEWLPITDKLDQRGWGWLIYDARGHGESSLTKGPDGASNGYKYFHAPGPGSEWEKMIDDVGAALNFLEKTKGIKRARVALMGASIGANICLNYAALTRSTAKVVLLSPGLNYQEIKTDEAMKKFLGKSILIVAHPADQYAFGSSVQLKEANPKIEMWTDVKPGHGVQMFDGPLMDRIVDWLQKSR